MASGRTATPTEDEDRPDRRLGLLEQGQARLESDFGAIREDFGEMRGDMRGMRSDLAAVVDEMRRGYKPQYAVWAAIGGVVLVVMGAFFAPYAQTLNAIDARMDMHTMGEGHQGSITRIAVLEGRQSDIRLDQSIEMRALEERTARDRSQLLSLLRAEMEAKLWQRRAEEGWNGGQ